MRRARPRVGPLLAGWLLFVPVSGSPAPAARQLDAWLGAAVTGFDYEEFDPAGASLDREAGALPGLGVGLRLAHAALFAETTLDLTAGRVDYRATRVATRTDTLIADWDGIAGCLFAAGDAWSAGLYAGLGYRQWQRDIHSTPVAFGLDETYRWGYGILGLRAAHALGAGAQLQADLQLTHTVDPSITVRFKAGYDDTTLDLGTAGGARRFTHTHELGAGMALFVSPWFEYWQLGRSAAAVLTRNGVPAGTVYEPDSETRNLGISAGVRWRVF
ncbi:MAG: hypothetical protein R3F42_07615 [Pseudomonadota bacterium]